MDDLRQGGIYIKAIIINGSPRKNWNTDKALKRAILSDSAKAMGQIMGYNELLYICNTYQFADYSRYDFNLFDEAEKRKYRDEHFAEDLEKAYQLGRSLVQKSIELN